MPKAVQLPAPSETPTAAAQNNDQTAAGFAASPARKNPWFKPEDFNLVLADLPEQKKKFDSLTEDRKREVTILSDQRSPSEIREIIKITCSNRYQDADTEARAKIFDQIQQLRFGDLIDLGRRFENLGREPQSNFEPPKNPTVARILADLNEPAYAKRTEKAAPVQTVETVMTEALGDRNPSQQQMIRNIFDSPQFQRLNDGRKAAAAGMIQKLTAEDLSDLDWRASNYQRNPQTEFPSPPEPQVEAVLCLLNHQNRQVQPPPQSIAELVPPTEKVRFEQLSAGRGSLDRQAIAEIIGSRPYRYLNEDGRQHLSSQIAAMDSADLLVMSGRLGLIGSGNPHLLADKQNTPPQRAIAEIYTSVTAPPPGTEKLFDGRPVEERLAIYTTLTSLKSSTLSSEDQKKLHEIIGACDTRSLWDLVILSGPNYSFVPSLLQQDKDGKNGLASLYDIVTAQSVRGPDLAANWSEFKREALHAVAHPYAAAQGNKGTCAATEPIRVFTDRQPAEALRIIRDLALEGRVKFRDGNWAELKTEALSDDGSRRNIVERMLQSTMMEYANGSETYHNKSDISEGPSNSHSGLHHNQICRLLTALYGQKYNSITGPGEELLKIVQSTFSTVHASADFAGSHLISIEKCFTATVTISNPWGHEIHDNFAPTESLGYYYSEGRQIFSRADFAKRLKAIFLPDTELQAASAQSPAPSPPQPPNWRDKLAQLFGKR